MIAARSSSRRRLVATAASVAFGALLVTSTVTASGASWVDQEWDAGAITALDCTAPDAVDTRAWGRVLTGQVLGASLDPVAATDGINVVNLAPATTSTGTSAAAPVSALGSDAWAAALGISALSMLDLGAGVTLPLDAGTGVYTQYGRATGTGIMTGASGAVTTDGAGLVSLEVPDASTPRLGTLRLSTVLDSVLPGLGTPAGRLSDVDLEVGAVGSVAELDSCPTIWDTSSFSGALDRDYLVAALRLGLTSDLVSGFGSTVDTTLEGLQLALDTELNAAVDTSIVTAVTSLLGTALQGIAGVSLGSNPAVVTVTGTVNLAPVRALLVQDITDGVVTINLASGRVSADLGALLGEAYADGDGLNGRTANTTVLQPAVINALLTRVSALLTSFVTNTIQPAVAKAILDTAIVVKVGATLNAVVTVIVPVHVPDIIRLDSQFSGTIGGFTGAAGYAAPTVASTVTLLPGQSGLVLEALNLLLAGVTGPLIAAVVSTVLPSIGSLVVQPILVGLSATVTGALATLTGTTVPALITALRPVFDLLATLVRITLNAQPDQPGSVGPPAASPAGRYFVSALQVGVVSGASSLLSLWAASASVGPYTRR
jgi:hypothetical protein